jgi:hypothetical protein
MIWHTLSAREDLLLWRMRARGHGWDRIERAIRAYRAAGGREALRAWRARR